MQITLSPPKTLAHWLLIFRLYRKAFPASERKPFGIILTMYRKEKTDLWCILSDGNFAGFASTVNGDDLILLDYLAVEGKHRGKGIGTAALNRLLSKYPHQGLFVEIENTYLPGADQPLRIRRKAFYRSCGMEDLNVTANVFGVSMELLGRNCQMDFAQYKRFYRNHYSAWAAEHITP
jgi:GNAT superfamily N-acetyltransferase